MLHISLAPKPGRAEGGVVIQSDTSSADYAVESWILYAPIMFRVLPLVSNIFVPSPHCMVFVRAVR